MKGINKKLLKNGMEISGKKNEKEFIESLIKEFIKKHKRKKILELEGKIKWEGNLNKLREGRF